MRSSATGCSRSPGKHPLRELQDRGMVLILPEELHPFYDVPGRFCRRRSAGSRMGKTGRTHFRWYREDIARGLRPEIAATSCRICSRARSSSRQIQRMEALIGLRESARRIPGFVPGKRGTSIFRTTRALVRLARASRPKRTGRTMREIFEMQWRLNIHTLAKIGKISRKPSRPRRKACLDRELPQGAFRRACRADP